MMAMQSWKRLGTAFIKATDPSEASHLTELEHTVLSRLNAAKQWGDDPPKIDREPHPPPPGMRTPH